ncbi:MAG TPA: DUF4142 domain-containing protein, partial [Kofleriaceae bacterium]|nr:DUF4142 domain-containing protein [Kofleriaceae bacterium]
MKIKSLVFAAALALPMAASAQAPTTTTDKTTTTTTDKTTSGSKTTTTTPDKSKTGTAAAKLAADDVKIVAHLHHVNVMEIDMGKQAKLKGTAAVKKYGDMMIKEHGAANKELAAMAKKKGVAKIPAAQPMT